MLSIFGLLLSFIGSGILAFNSIKSKRQIFKQTSTGQTVVLDSEKRNKLGFEKAWEEALREMPDVQAKIWQSTVAIIGFSFLTLGFIIQLTSAILTTVFS